MNTYNGLVKLQQDRTFEINNESSRGYNGTANTALADQLIVGLNATQVTYDENGNPIYNSGLEGVDAINVNDYKRTSTLDYDALAKVDNSFNSGAYNLGVKGYDKSRFLIDNENNIERITNKNNEKLADQLFFMGVTGDPTGSTAVKNRVDQNLLEKDKNGNIIPPSKSMVNMEIMKDLYRTMGENAFDAGALKVQEKNSLTPNNLNFAANLSSGEKVIRHPEKKGYYFIQGPDGLYYESFNRGAKVVKEKDGEILVDQKPQNGSSIEDLQNEYGIQVETTTQSSQGDYNYLQEGPDYNRFIQGEMNPDEEYSFALAILGLGGKGTQEELEDKFSKEEIIKKAKEGSDIKLSEETKQNLPEEGEKWGSFDYSQQEPRLVVHYANKVGLDGSKKLLEAYRDNKNTDFHTIMAEIASIPRKSAKTINLGLFYGMGVGKLADQLGIDPDEAKSLINQYNERVPFVRQLADKVSDHAQRKGRVRTILGRQCRFDLWEPKSFGVHKAYPYEKAVEEYGSNIGLKRAGTYKSLNRLIQGSAADQIKKAMVELHKEGIIPMIQIHDELAISVDGTKEQQDKIIEVMENCLEMEIPSKVDVSIAENWGKTQ